MGKAVRDVSVEYEPQPVRVGNSLTQWEPEVDMYWKRFVPSLSDLQVPPGQQSSGISEISGIERMEE
jgi:hypothetical protein